MAEYMDRTYQPQHKEPANENRRAVAPYNFVPLPPMVKSETW